MSKAWNEAFALKGLGAALQAFAQAKKEKKAQANFEAELALKALELEDAKQQRKYAAWTGLQDDLRTTRRMGQPQYVYNDQGKVVGSTPAVYGPEELARVEAEYRATFDQRFNGLPAVSRPPSPPPYLGQEEQPAPFTVNIGDTPGAKETINGGSGSGGDGSKFWDKLDTEFATTVQQWETSGRAEFAAGSAALESTANDFLTGKVKGGWLGLIPGRALTRPELDQAVKSVEKVVFPQLRATMGAQFTEKEGARVIAATIDPLQKGENNARRLLVLNEVMKEQAQAKEKMIAHAKKYGTLRGYENPSVGLTADELIKRVQAKVGATPPPESTQFIQQMESQGFKFKGVK